MRLKSEIEAKAVGDRPMFGADDLDKVKTSIADLLEISKRFKQALEVLSLSSQLSRSFSLSLSLLSLPSSFLLSSYLAM
jgi:hypothetical protein